MASKTDQERNLIGSMALVPPGDKSGPGNSLLMQNFRIDQENCLRTRFGAVKAAGPVGSGDFHTLRRSGNARSAGIGTSLWGFGSDISSELVSGLDGEALGIAFYRGAGWLMNRAKQKKFVEGTIDPWGVDAPGDAPTAEGGGQLTSTLSDFTGGNINVGVDSPPHGTEPFSIYAMKGGAPGWTDDTEIFGEAAPRDPFVEAKFDGDGGTVRAKSTVVTAVTMFAKIGAGTAVDGKTLDTDTFRFQFFASNPVLIESVSVYLRSGERSDPDHGFVEFAFTDPKKWINQSLSSWTTLKVRRSLNLDDYSQKIAAAAAAGNQQAVSDLEAQFATAIQTPTFVYTGSGWPQTGIGGPQPATYPPSEEMLRIDWGSITEIGITAKISVNLQDGDQVQVGAGKAEVVGTVGANSSGAINYFVTDENVYGEESNPSPASNSVIAGNQSITVTVGGGSSESRIAAKRVYRIGGGLSQALQVKRISGAGGGSFVDDVTNAQAQADGIEMPTNHDLPPHAKGCIGPFFGKIVAFNTNDHAARYFWTPAGQPWYFPGAADDFLGNWEDAGGDDDPIIQATDHKQMLLFYKQRSIWRLAGDPDTTDPVKTNSQVGLAGPNAVCNGGAVDYFVGFEGVFRFNGDFEEKLSKEIDPIFKGDFVQLSDGEFLPPISVSHVDKCAIELIGDRLRVSYPEAGQSSPNVVATYHLVTQRWGLERYTNLAAPAFSILKYEGQGAAMMAGAPGGYLYQLEAQGFYLDDGQPAKAIWQSQFFDQGLPDNWKIYTDVVIDCQTRAGAGPSSTLSVYLVYDNGTKIHLGDVTSTDAAKPRFSEVLRVMNEAGTDPGRRGRNAAVRVESDFTGTIVIYGVFLHWYPEERNARTFDTGPTDLGMPERCKEADYLELYLTASGQQLQRVLSSDLPGNLLTHRDNGQFTAPNGRGTVRFRLADHVDGRNFRFWVDDSPSSSPFQVHQARIRMRPIGEYIDGTINEYFECAEFSVAPGRVGELKDFLLDYDCSGGNGRLLIYSDLPGNELVQVREYVIPEQTRAPRMFPFEDPTLSAAGGPSTTLPYGQLFKVRMYPPAGGILRLHGRAVFRARIIGVYFDGTRGEIWETQPLDLLDGMGVFREVAVVTQSEGPMFLEVRTELPGQDMATIARFDVNPSATTPGRLPFIGRLPGSAKGRLQQFRLVGPHVARVFECKVLARRTQLDDTPWVWVPVPLEVTPDAWAEIQMPVRVTPESFAWVEFAPDPIE